MTEPLMRAAGRESYAAALDGLRAYAGGTDPARLTAAGDQVLSMAALLRAQPRLRRALADATSPAPARVELLRGLLAGKLDDAALDLIAPLVAGRWSVPSELLDATERLGVEALLTAAGGAGELADVEDELFRFSQLVAGDSRLSSALGDSTSPVDRRAGLVRNLLEGKARPVTVRLAELAVAGFGGRGFVPSLGRLVEMAAAQRDRTVAYVTTAVPPTEAEEQRLADRLAQMYGHQVSLKVEVNPQVLGGVRVRVGSDLYDGTVLRRLSEARQALAS